MGNAAAKALGATLREWREHQGWTLRVLAAELGYASHSELSAYERGERVLPAGRVDDVALVLGGNAADLRHLRDAAAAEHVDRRSGMLQGGRPIGVRPRAQRFVGRSAVLRELADALDDRPAVVLRGEPGMGVREAALEFASRHAGRFTSLEWRRAARGLDDVVASPGALVVIEAEKVGDGFEHLVQQAVDTGGRVIVAVATSVSLAALPVVTVPPFDAIEVAAAIDDPNTDDRTITAIAAATGGSPLALELFAAVVGAGRHRRALAGDLGADPVDALVRVAVDQVQLTSPAAFELLRVIADSGTDLIAREQLSIVGFGGSALVDAVGVLRDVALLRPSSDHVWTHALVRDALRRS